VVAVVVVVTTIDLQLLAQSHQILQKFQSQQQYLLFDVQVLLLLKATLEKSTAVLVLEESANLRLY
jgi:hypothetical protein